VSYKQSCDNML